MFKKTHLSVVFLAGVMLQPANAANVSITTGQADFLLDYTVNGSNGAFQDTFNYYKLGFSTRRGDYTFGLNVSGLLETTVQEYFENTPDGNPDVERDSISVFIARPISDNLTLSGGFYTSEVKISDSNFEGPGDSIETEALFASLTFSDQLTDQLFWYGRLGAQINEAELTVHPNEEPIMKETLDGVAWLLGAGVVYPFTGSTSLTFGFEYKDFIYDGGLWDLNEDQTLFTIGYNYGF
jgi:opacity protein-like surface antigen